MDLISALSPTTGLGNFGFISLSLSDETACWRHQHSQVKLLTLLVWLNNLVSNTNGYSSYIIDHTSDRPIRNMPTWVKEHEGKIFFPRVATQGILLYSPARKEVWGKGMCKSERGTCCYLHGRGNWLLPLATTQVGPRVLTSRLCACCFSLISHMFSLYVLFLQCFNDVCLEEVILMVLKCNFIMYIFNYSLSWLPLSGQKGRLQTL